MHYRKKREEDFEEFYLDDDYEELYDPRADLEEDDEDELDEIQRMRNRKKQQPPKNRPSRQKTGSMHSAAEHPAAVNSRRRRKRGKSSRRKKLLAAVLILIAAVVGILFFQRWWKMRDGYWNIAVFGVDSRSGNLERGALSDVEIICSINKKTKEARLISVYRDSYLQIDEESSFDKINEAYFLGGHEQAVAALERNLDIQIDDYATFNWKAVADAINLLGGIDLEITDAEFSQINSFITETVNSTGIGSFQLEHAGMNHLDGVQAVAYSRLRLMDTDFNRTERQRKVIQLALEKAKQADAATLTNIIMSVLPQLSTSIGAEDLIPIARDISKYEIGMTAGFPFAKTTTRIQKKDCVIPMTLESNVAALHYFLYGEAAATYTVPSSVKKISSHIAEVSGIYEEGEIPGFVYEGSKESEAGANQQAVQTEPSRETTAEPVPETEPAATVSEAPAESETESLPETTEESIEESVEESSEQEGSSDDSEEEIPEGPVSPLAPEEQTRPVTPGTSGGTEEGPGAGLPAPGESEQGSSGIIHSGTENSGTVSAPSEAEEIGPGVQELPLYTGPDQP